MMTENSILMSKASESLKGKWGLAIGTFVIYMMIVSIIGALIPFAHLIVGGAFQLGISIFSLSIARQQDSRVEQIFAGFNNFGRALSAFLLIFIFVLFWLLLLIIPGIIASISYSMTFFILADDDSISAMDAIKKSKQMMNGYKWKYFRLSLRFFGLALLYILTLGIGFLWLIPYQYVTYAKFYDDVKNNYLLNQQKN